MKKYTVHYVIKKNNTGYPRSMEIEAKNQREAMAAVKDKVYNQTGRNAFWTTCKAPQEEKGGLLWGDGRLCGRWNKWTGTLW